MQFFYTLGISLYTLGIRLLSPWNPKAKHWISGRKDWKSKLQTGLAGKKDWVWFHCASLGEFEQGRPLIEKFKRDYPQYPILLTFFSPSGYENVSKFKDADFIFYLPADIPPNVNYFLDKLQPKLVFFIKYDIWVNYILTLAERRTPTFLVSANVTESSSFLSGLTKNLYGKAFQSFRIIFTQNEITSNLLRTELGVKEIEVSGDVRFDRVKEIAENVMEVPGIKSFVKDHFCIVAGSVYAEEITMIQKLAGEQGFANIKWIIAPHEINESQIDQSIKNENVIAYSEIEKCNESHDTLWIDSIGILNKIYQYADLAIIGGGFGKGIHNIQEPAIFGCPVTFGSRIRGFQEAEDLVEMNLGKIIQDQKALREFILTYLNDPQKLERDSQRIRDYMIDKSGATSRIFERLKKDSFLD